MRLVDTGERVDDVLATEDAGDSLLAPEVARAFLISTTSLSSELEYLSLREWWLIYEVGWER